MGSIQLAGRNADRLVADVAAADLITLRAAQDAQNLADRIRLGMLEEFGGDLPAAMSALRAHYQVAPRRGLRAPPWWPTPRGPSGGSGPSSPTPRRRGGDGEAVRCPDAQPD